jgi:uncharacterized protein (TIGR03435 family)
VMRRPVTAASHLATALLLGALPVTAAPQAERPTQTKAPAPAQPDAAPAFDAISIKPNRSGEQGGSSRAQPGRYVGVNVTLMRLVRLAYRPIEEFDGGPDWKDRDHFDIEAVASGNPGQPQMLAMLRSLLADRFKLLAHIETRPLPVYELSLARPDGRLGPSLARVAASCPPPGSPPQTPGPNEAANQPVRCGFRLLDGVLSGAGTLANLASELSVAGRRVVDRSSLEGVYRIELRWSPESAAPAAPDAPPEIFTALREQLGLKLQPATAPIDVAVIDRAERPAEN